MRMILISAISGPLPIMYICICNAITDREIAAAAELGARTVDDLRDTLGVATCCRRCEDTARDVLNGALATSACACAGND